MATGKAAKSWLIFLKGKPTAPREIPASTASEVGGWLVLKSSRGVIVAKYSLNELAGYELRQVPPKRWVVALPKKRKSSGSGPVVA